MEQSRNIFLAQRTGQAGKHSAVADATDELAPDPSEDLEVVREDFVRFAGRLQRREVSIQVSHSAAVMAAMLEILSGKVPGADGLRTALLREILS